MCREDMNLECTDEVAIQGGGCKEGKNIFEENSWGGEVGVLFERGSEGFFEHFQLFKVTLVVLFGETRKRHIVLCNVRCGVVALNTT